MFRSKPLLATPRDTRKENRGFEFTPIGAQGNVHSQHGRNSTVKKDVIHELINKKREGRGPLNELNGGSSFIDESTYDTIEYAQNQQHQQQTKPNSSSPVHNDFNNRDLLNDGSNPVRQQQEDISNLKSENYNLKVKVASLTKYLNAISSQDQQYIYEENSRLQEQLVALRGEVKDLNRELASRPTMQFDPKTKVLEEELNIERLKNNKFNDQYDYKLKELEKLQNEFERLESKHHQMKDGYEDKLQELEHQERAHNSSSPSKTLVNELYAKIDDLRAALEDKDYEIRQKENELDNREEEIELLEQNLKQAQQQSSQISHHGSISESQMEELKLLISDRDSKIQQQDRQIHLLKTELEHNVSKVSKASHQSQDLSDALNATQRKLALLEEAHANRSTGDRSAQEIIRLKNLQIELEGEIDQLKNKLRESKSIITEQNEVIGDLRDTEFRLDDLQREKEHLRLKIEQLERENERNYKAYNDLKKSSLNMQKVQSKEGLWKSEVESLSNQIEDLNLENQKLYKDLEKQRDNRLSDVDSYAKLEVKSLSSKCNELQMELSDKENAMQKLISQHNREHERLKSTLLDREDELSKIRDEFRSLKIATTEKIDDEKVELLKLKSSKESQVKLLQLELDNLKEQHRIEVESLKNMIAKLRQSASISSDLLKDNHSDKTDEVLSSLSEKNKRIKFLTEKLTTALMSVKELQTIVSQLERSKDDLQIDNKRLGLKLDHLTDKLYDYKKEIQRLADRNQDQEDYDQIRTKLKLKEQEILDYKLLKGEIADKYRQVNDENQALQRRIEKIVSRYRQLQSSYSENVTQSKDAVKLQNQADYYKMKHIKATYVIKDLKFVNSFMVKSIQATNSHIKQDIKKMQQVGIYPDYDLICNKKPSLVVLFKFVVAAVRMKRKSNHSATRNQKIELLEVKLLR